MYGSFQLKLGPSYLTELFKSHTKLRMYIKKIENSENSKIITTRIRSRHISKKSFRIYLWYNSTNEQENSNPSRILDWYCECKNGSRAL